MGRIDVDEKTPVVAVIGLNRLEQRAIAHILIEAGIRVNLIPMTRVCFDNSADLWLTTPEALAENLEHFLSRKETTILYCHHAPESFMFASFTPDVNDTEIVNIFDSALKAATKDDEKCGRLSLRETDVLRLIAKGLTIKEIGQALCISVNTVATHRKNISSKLGIRTISGLSLYAAMNGIIND